MLFQPGVVIAGQRVRPDVLDALLLEKLGEQGQAFLLVLLEPLDFDEKLLQLLLRRAAVGALDGDALADLASQPGHPDHEELVEIGGRDRQEPDPLEQRVMRILGLLQDAAIELQP